MGILPLGPGGFGAQSLGIRTAQVGGHLHLQGAFKLRGLAQAGSGVGVGPSRVLGQGGCCARLRAAPTQASWGALTAARRILRRPIGCWVRMMAGLRPHCGQPMELSQLLSLEGMFWKVGAEWGAATLEIASLCATLLWGLNEWELLSLLNF